MARSTGPGVGALLGGVLVLIAMLVIGSLVARMAFGPAPVTTTAASSSPPPPPPPNLPPLASSAPRPPLAFNDPENQGRFEAAQKSLAELQALPDSIAKGKPEAIDAARVLCATAMKQASSLEGEPHPTVKELVSRMQRACLYERPLASLRAQMARIAAARKQTGKAPLDQCKAAAATVKEIVDAKYDDDETMAAELAKLGQLCV